MNALRPVKPIPLPNLELGKLSSATPTFTWVDPKELLIEDEYQRSLTKASIWLIRQIASRFDWTRIKPVVCAKNDKGKLCVIDGQHTAIAAASRGDVPKVPVMIVEAPTGKVRAAAFVSHNMDRLNITPMQLYYSQVANGDAVAVAMKEVCEGAAVTIKRTQPPNGRWQRGDTVAVVAIRRLVERRGKERAARVLKTLVAAKRAPVLSHEIIAVAAVLFDPKFSWQGAAFDLVTVIRSKSGDAWVRQVNARTRSDGKMTLWQAVAEAWLRAYKREAA